MKSILVKRLAVVSALALLVAGGILTGLCRGGDRKVPILMYHKIGDTEDSPWWVTRHDFEEQLKALAEAGYSSILPSDLVAHRRWGWPLPRKPVMITFDDGYLNVMENAEPILARHGFRAVCYLITGLIADSPEQRKQWEGTPLLIWSEVKALQARGTVRFGGHSRNHANLAAMADPQEEISGCYRDLRKKGGLRRPEGFCYPYGQYKAQTLACLAKTRFTTATTCEDGIAQTGPGMNCLELPRVSVMGGNRRFHVQSAGGDGRKVVVRVSLEGKPLEVCPRLVSSGVAGAGWLGRVTVSAEPALLSWPLPADGGQGGAVVELWDLFHIIRYYAGPLQSMDDGRRP